MLLAAVRRARRMLDALEVRLDPPLVVVEPEPTVPEWQQAALRADEAQRERNAELFARLMRQLAEQRAEMAIHAAHERAAEMQLN